MYVWFAIGLERQLQELRRALVEIEKKAGREDPALTLPMHCSLKISFEIDGDERDKLYDMLTEYFEEQKAFFVKPCSFETLGKLCWLSIEPCAELVRIHAELDALLYERFGVLQHEFDHLDGILFVDHTRNRFDTEKALAEHNLPPLEVDKLLEEEELEQIIQEKKETKEED